MSESSVEPSGWTVDDGDPVDDVGHAVGTAFALAEWLVLIGAALVWTGFWGTVARLHYTMGDIGNAGLTLLLFVSPLIVLALWHVGRTLDTDVVSKVPIDFPDALSS